MRAWDTSRKRRLQRTRIRLPTSFGTRSRKLLRPSRTTGGYFAALGWVGSNLPGLPTSESVWTLAQGSVLSPGHPVTLTHGGGTGLVLSRTE